MLQTVLRLCWLNLRFPYAAISIAPLIEAHRRIRKELKAAAGDEAYRTPPVATDKQRAQFTSRRRSDKDTRAL